MLQNSAWLIQVTVDPVELINNSIIHLIFFLEANPSTQPTSDLLLLSIFPIFSLLPSLTCQGLIVTLTLSLHYVVFVLLTVVFPQDENFPIGFVVTSQSPAPSHVHINSYCFIEFSNKLHFLTQHLSQGSYLFVTGIVHLRNNSCLLAIY